MTQEQETGLALPRRGVGVLLRVAVGLAVGALLFWLVYWRQTDVYEVLDVFYGRHARYPLLIAVAFIDMLVLLLRSVKWRLILRPIRRVAIHNAFSATAIGVMTTNLVPFRLDEVVRSFILGRRERLPVPVVFGTVAVERSVDILVLFVAVAVTAATIAVPAELAGAVPWVGALLAVAAGALTLAGFRGRRLAERLRRVTSGRLRHWAAWLAGAAEGFAHAVRAVPRDWRLPAVLGLAVAEIGLSVAVAALTAAALGVAFPPAALLVVVLCGYASFAIPASPGAFGVYHSINVLALTRMCHADPRQAAAFVLLLHAMLVVPSSLVGLACLWREHLGLRRFLFEGRKRGRSASSREERRS